MRNRVFLVTAAATAWALSSAPTALAQSEGPGSRPWHYWVAPLLLVGGIAVVAAIGVGYYVRVMGGRRR